jgi:cytochrome P450
MNSVNAWEAARQRFHDHFRRHPVAYSRIRSALSRNPLPPGDYAALDELERADRDALRKRAEVLGPVFKGIAWGELYICIIGLERCRRFTQEHRTSVRMMSMELEHLIPKGFISAMEGDGHREMRRALQRALRSTAAGAGDPVLDAIVADALRDYAHGKDEHSNAATAFTAAMSGVATAMLTWIFFGAKPGTAVHARILAHFHELGPYGLVWNPQKRQELAFRAFFEDVRTEVAAMRAGTGTLSPAGLLGCLAEEDALDDTMLGNIIYMAEMGRSDMKNFFRWLTRHASDDPAMLERIRAEDAAGDSARPLVEAFVQETLRTDQSERCIRLPTRDIVFDGFLIPRHATIRLCLWESHHTEGAFADPHRFDPERFVNERPGNDRFAPFGIDHHQCPMGNPVARMGVVFMRALARGYRVRVLTEGPPVRGGYHWEPSPRFAVELNPL